MLVNNIEAFIMSSERKSTIKSKVQKSNPISKSYARKPVEPQKVRIATKAIRNECLQSLEVYFIDENGVSDTHWLQPKEILKLPASSITDQISLLQQRRLVRIFDI